MTGKRGNAALVGEDDWRTVRGIWAAWARHHDTVECWARPFV